MWISNSIIQQVDERVLVFYLANKDIQAWNKNRKPNEIRMLTGWCWMQKDGRLYRQGFKTATVCYRDAYYACVQRSNAPIPGKATRRKMRS